MKKIELFFDSSALIAGIISAKGAARVLLLLSEVEKIRIIVSEQVIVEVERNIARKAPQALPYARELIRAANIRIVRDPQFDQVRQHQQWINHPVDVPILVAAVNTKVEFLVTLNPKHFIDDPDVARKSGLRIGTPGDALKWVWEKLKGENI
jgi:predicted nucleic acid-binding protein